MNFFKNLVRRRRIRNLAAYKNNLEYYKKIAEAEKKTIDNLQKLIDDLPIVNTAFPYINAGYKAEYIKKFHKHHTQLSDALGEIEYWQTLYDDLYNELYPEQKWFPYTTKNTK